MHRHSDGVQFGCPVADADIKGFGRREQYLHAENRNTGISAAVKAQLDSGRIVIHPLVGGKIKGTVGKANTVPVVTADLNTGGVNLVIEIGGK